jgi:FemAB-related protein (PEP-CTERM system-associated)
MQRAFGHECVYLAARDERGALEGVLPLVRVRSRIFGHFLVSMPFLNYGGPLGEEGPVVALVEHAEQMALRDGVSLLAIRNRCPLPVAHPPSNRKITAVLDLPSRQPEALWRRLDAKVRSQVRRPQKEGVTVAFGPDQLEPFYEVLARHMRDLGTPVQSRVFFERIAETFAGDVWFGCAYLRGRPIACGCGFQGNGEFEMTWASALREHVRIAPNMLLYWSFIERATEASIPIFNFGRCTPGGNTHRFKRQWGSRDEPLWWYELSFGRIVATPSADASCYAWGPRIWKHLPVRMATALGPRIVRYIP